MASSFITLVITLSYLLSFTFGATIQWTGGAGNGLWNFPNNWVSNSVPTQNDDVIIQALGGASVTVSQAAAARSVSLGGNVYPQTLTLLSQLTVGAGGITVASGGTLQVQSNNALPLSSSGSVVVNSGASLIFQSGSLNGPGAYTINSGAVLIFSQSSLKQIAATNVTNFGTSTIQSTTIQLAAGGSFINRGNVSAIGGITIFSSDNTGASFVNYGTFTYEGQLTTTPLFFQLATSFYSDLNILSGAVSLADTFTSNSTVIVPSGSVLTTTAGTTTKTLNVVKGAGEFEVEGITVLLGPVSLSSLIITDSGSLTLNTGASFTGASVGGKLTVQTTVSLSNLTVAGGTITGPGTTSVSGYLIFTTSDSGNDNNFISSTVVLYGQGQILTPVYLLLGDGGLFHVAAGATLTILASTNFGIQSGKPQVIVDGTIDVTLTSSASITSNVNFGGSGSGTLKVNAGTIVFNGDVVILGSLFLAVNSFVTFQTVTATIQSVTGTGGLNLTSTTAPVSTLGSVSLSYLGVLTGSVTISNFAVDKFEYWNGAVTLGSASTNTATTFNWYGGSLTGPAKLTTSALNINAILPVSIDAVAIKTTTFSLQSPGTGSVQTSNGAAIIADSSLISPPIRNGITFN